jgi:hypothetical protein
MSTRARDSLALYLIATTAVLLTLYGLDLARLFELLLAQF